MKQPLPALRRFYTGRWYPILVALLIFLGHCAAMEALFALILALTLVPALLLCEDVRFGILPFLCAIFIVSVRDYTPSNPGYDEQYLNAPFLVTLSVAVILVLAALVFFLIRNRKHRNPFPRRGMFWSMAFVCALFALNGSLSPAYSIGNFLYVLLIAASLLPVYALFVLFLRFDESAFDYFMYCLVVAGLLIVAELIFAFFTTVQFVDGEIVKGSVVLGWGVWTNIGGMLAFLMPACFYFAHSHRHGWIGYVLGLLEYLCIVLSQSRGALLIGTLILALCLLYVCVGGSNRKQNRIFTACIGVCAVIGILFLSEKLFSLVRNFADMGLADNGRFEMWKIGIDKFCERPLFGSGFYDSYHTEEWDMGPLPYLYHNTAVQVLGATGIVGAVAYLYHRFHTVKLVIMRPNFRKTILGTCILALLLFSLTDVLLFKIYPTIYYSLMLLFIEHSQGEKGT